jgi:hypothetical protein
VIDLLHHRSAKVLNAIAVGKAWQGGHPINRTALSAAFCRVGLLGLDIQSCIDRSVAASRFGAFYRVVHAARNVRAYHRESEILDLLANRKIALPIELRLHLKVLRIFSPFDDQ